jgi:hypothetical protein
MPGCNWELYELRVIVFTNAAEGGSRGLVGAGPKFFSVTLDIPKLGIGEFKGSGLDCNFTVVFNELIKRKALAFACRQKDNDGNHFSRVQAAQRNKENLPGAKLYVHLRGGISPKNIYPEKITELGVLLLGVTVKTSVLNKDVFYIHLEGNEASPVNF